MLTKLPYEEFKAIYSKVPRACADLIIKTNKGVLLTLRDIKPWKGMWHLPGGTILFQEIVEEAVKRVAREELGVGVEIEKFLGYFEHFKDLDNQGHSVDLAYLVNITEGQLRINHQASRIEYFKQLPENVIKEHQLFLEQLQIL